MRLGLVTLLFALGLAACGGEGFIIVSVNTGTVATDPMCTDVGGHFDLRDQGGLLVLVVIDSQTAVLRADRSAGACTDLEAGTRVEVRGRTEGEGIDATEVRVL